MHRGGVGDVPRQEKCHDYMYCTNDVASDLLSYGCEWTTGGVGMSGQPTDCDSRFREL